VATLLPDRPTFQVDQTRGAGVIESSYLARFAGEAIIDRDHKNFERRLAHDGQR
jgi:hypothetical protein